jgi:hypothetical protein
MVKLYVQKIQETFLVAAVHRRSFKKMSGSCGTAEEIRGCGGTYSRKFSGRGGALQKIQENFRLRWRTAEDSRKVLVAVAHSTRFIKEISELRTLSSNFKKIRGCGGALQKLQ